MKLTEATTSELPPACPAWCRYREVYPDHSHGYDSHTPDGALERHHVSAREWAYVVAEELNRDGVVTYSEPYVYVAVECGEQLTAAAAREFAMALSAAAAGLAQVGGQR